MAPPTSNAPTGRAPATPTLDVHSTARVAVAAPARRAVWVRGSRVMGLLLVESLPRRLSSPFGCRCRGVADKGPTTSTMTPRRSAADESAPDRQVGQQQEEEEPSDALPHPAHPPPPPAPRGHP